MISMLLISLFPSVFTTLSRHDLLYPSHFPFPFRSYHFINRHDLYASHLFSPQFLPHYPDMIISILLISLLPSVLTTLSTYIIFIILLTFPSPITSYRIINKHDLLCASHFPLTIISYHIIHRQDLYYSPYFSSFPRFTLVDQHAFTSRHPPQIDTQASTPLTLTPCTGTRVNPLSHSHRYINILNNSHSTA